MGGGGEQWPTKPSPPLIPAPPLIEDMYKVISRIVLALGSPSGLSVEIRGGGISERKCEIGMQEMGPAPHPGDDKGMESPQCPSCSLPLDGRARIGNSVQGTSKAIAF